MVVRWKHWATRKGASRGAAWLSSARVVRCWVKSRNERNPYPMLLPRKGRTLGRLPRITWRKAGMTSSPHGLYVQGYTRATMAGTTSSKSARRSKSLKAGPSSDSGLQFAHLKAESLVIGDQLAPVNTFPGLVHTARQAMEAGSTRSRSPNRKEGNA